MFTGEEKDVSFVLSGIKGRIGVDWKFNGRNIASYGMSGIQNKVELHTKLKPTVPSTGEVTCLVTETETGRTILVEGLTLTVIQSLSFTKNYGDETVGYLGGPAPEFPILEVKISGGVPPYQVMWAFNYLPLQNLQLEDGENTSSMNMDVITGAHNFEGMRGLVAVRVKDATEKVVEDVSRMSISTKLRFDEPPKDKYVFEYDESLGDSNPSGVIEIKPLGGLYPVKSSWKIGDKEIGKDTTTLEIPIDKESVGKDENIDVTLVDKTGQTLSTTINFKVIKKAENG